MRRWALVLLVAAVVGCVTAGGDIHCGPFGTCPFGQRCAPGAGPGGIDVCVPWPPDPSPTPTPSPTAVPTPTPHPTPTPTPTPAPTPTATPLPSPTPSPCLTGCPADAWTCSDKQEWEVGQGNWHRAPSGAPYRIYGCPPGAPEVPGCAGQVCLNGRCDRVACGSGQVLAPAEDGWFGICVPRPCDPSPTPSATPPPTPGPCPSPSSCPKLQVWRGGLHNCADSRSRPSKKADGSPLPVGDGWCVVDTTPGFVGGPRGLPCNDEHNAVCSCTGTDQPPTATTWRRCEDPRGPTFEVSGSGVASWRVDDNTFQIKVKHNASGDVFVLICPRTPLLDSLGKVVEVQGDACRGVSWSF